MAHESHESTRIKCISFVRFVRFVGDVFVLSCIGAWVPGYSPEHARGTMSLPHRSPDTPFEKPRFTPRVVGKAEWSIVSIVTVLAAVVMAVWNIGDVSFLQDEPRLLAKAYHCNAAGTIESCGLNGNFGIPYGPLPTQIYQV